MTDTLEMKTTTVRPGLLVLMKTSITGNMKFTSTTLENRQQDDGAQFSRREETCTIFDPEEQKVAQKIRSDVSTQIISSCCYTAFGLLCPDDKVEKFREAWAKARRTVDEFNARSKYSYIRLYVMVGRILPDDREALESIALEVRNLIDTMEAGVKEADVKKIRDAALAARQIEGMLTDSAREEVKQAIELARAAATKYAKAGEAAAREVDLEAVKQITARRSAFLDLSGITEVKAPARVNRRAMELPKDVPAAVVAKPRKRVSIEVPAEDLGDIPALAPRKRKAVQLDIEDAINVEVGAANARVQKKAKKAKKAHNSGATARA